MHNGKELLRWYSNCGHCGILIIATREVNCRQHSVCLCFVLCFIWTLSVCLFLCNFDRKEKARMEKDGKTRSLFVRKRMEKEWRWKTVHQQLGFSFPPYIGEKMDIRGLL